MRHENARQPNVCPFVVVVAAREAKKRLLEKDETKKKKRTKKKALHKNKKPILVVPQLGRSSDSFLSCASQNAEENEGIKARDRSTTTAKVYT